DHRGPVARTVVDPRNAGLAGRRTTCQANVFLLAGRSHSARDRAGVIRATKLGGVPVMVFGNRLAKRLELGNRLGGRHAVLDERAAAIRSRRHGIIGLVVVVASLAVTAMAYLTPTSQAGYTAHMPDSAGVRAGDQVRIAGIPVGKVASVRLDGALVEMKFDVENSVVVGSESTLDIKLLTPLGGHYVALDPKGALPLGRNVIPPQRITLPFEVNDIIQAATPAVKEVDGQVI